MVTAKICIVLAAEIDQEVENLDLEAGDPDQAAAKLEQIVEELKMMEEDPRQPAESLKPQVIEATRVM